MTTLNSAWINGKNIVVLLLGIGLMYLVVHLTIENRLNDIEINTRVLIAEQQATLENMAEVTARTGADAVTEKIIRDCTTPERVRFDQLLDRLNQGLTQSELTELDRLFGRCGTFYSERKGVMVARFAREVAVYDAYVTQLGIVKSEDLQDAFSVAKWHALVDAEQERSKYFTELVRLQDNIIATLLAGKAQSSPEIDEILGKVKEVQDAMYVASQDAFAIRSELIPE